MLESITHLAIVKDLLKYRMSAWRMQILPLLCHIIKLSMPSNHGVLSQTDAEMSLRFACEIYDVDHRVIISSQEVMRIEDVAIYRRECILIHTADLLR